MTIFSVFIFLISIWTLAFYSSRMLREDMEDDLGKQQFAMASYMASDIDGGFKDRMDALELVAKALGPDFLGQPAALQNYIEQQIMFPLFFNGGVMVLDRHGTAIVDFPVAGRVGLNFLNRDFMVTALTEGKSNVGGPVLGKQPNTPIFVMAVPIRDNKGDVIGVLAGATELAKPNFLDAITKAYSSNGGYHYLVDPKHRLIVTTTDKRRIMAQLPDPGVNPFIDRNMRGYEGPSTGINALGVEVLASTMGIPAAGWYVVTSIPAAEAFAPVHEMQRRMVLVTAMLTLLAASATWWMLRRELTPMIAAAKTLATQSASDQPMRSLPIVKQDEIGELVGGFNRLLETLAQRENDLLTSKNKLSEAQSIAHIGSWELDLVHNRLTWSEEMYNIFGLLPGAFGSDYETFLDTLHPDDRNVVDRAYISSLEEGGRYNIEYRIIRKSDGQLHWGEARGEHERDASGKAIRSYGTVQDITERKRLESDLIAAKAEAERANNAKSRFLAAASHDLRQPLLALSLYVSLIKESSTPDGADLKVKLQSCVANLSELLNDLLDVSKLDAGVVKPEPTDIDVDALLASIAAVHSAEAELKGLDLHVHYSGGAVARTDHRLIQQILNNLVANAIRYTAQGGVLIACRRHRGKHWVEVWDTGIGFAEDQAGIIFEEFQQLGDDARNRGSGLGLSIVAKAAALLDLEIRVRSRPGRGSMFAVELPPGAMVAAPLPAAVRGATRQLRIALVEDNAMALEAMVLALESSRHEVIWAKSGRELIDKLGQQAPDLVISDYRLAAGETGFDVIAAVRNLFADHLPAILITGDTDPAVVRSMTDRGIALLYKPLDMEALQLAIAELVERRAG